jgi:hypothetical protein
MAALSRSCSRCSSWTCVGWSVSFFNPSEGAEGYCTWQDLASLQHLQQLVLWRCVLPGRLHHAPPVLQRVNQLKVCLLGLPMYEPPTAQLQAQAVQGLLTDAAPDLECLEVEDGVQSTSGIADAAAALAGHIALASLSLTSIGHYEQHELAWPGQPLASISRLMRLVLRELEAVDVLRGLLHGRTLLPALGWASCTWALRLAPCLG